MLHEEMAVVRGWELTQEKLGTKYRLIFGLLFALVLLKVCFYSWLIDVRN